MQLEKTDEQEFEGEAYQPKALLPFMKRVPAKRVVHLPEAAQDPVEFSLSFNESLPLPQGISTTQLANFHVTGDIQAHMRQVSRPRVVGGRSSPALRLPRPAAQELGQLEKRAWASEEGCMPLLVRARPCPGPLHCKEGWPALWSTAQLRHSVTDSNTNTNANCEKCLTWC